jgi:hypothetical protein
MKGTDATETFVEMPGKEGMTETAMKTPTEKREVCGGD